jgi:HD-GYP domain-containing protein (c-di-GMP phosphodiesterase class II)
MDAPVDAATLEYQRLSAAYQQSLRYAQDVRRLYQQLQRSIYQSLVGLCAAIEAKDPYTRGHSERVGAWSRRLAARLGVGADDAERIGQAGLLHDIGKIGVPESVLGKRGALADEEWEVMRRHPLLGAQIVAPFEMLAGVDILIRHHHERVDGSGYPDGLRGDAVPLGCRIIAVADVYDALTSDRPYRSACSHDDAMAVLFEEAGRVLEARVVSAFADVVGDVVVRRAV